VFLSSEDDRYFNGWRFIMGLMFNKAAANHGIVSGAGMLIFCGAHWAEGEAILKMLFIYVADALHGFKIGWWVNLIYLV
jgi:hypothetical protein